MEIKDYEMRIEAQHTVKSFTPESLGQGHSRGGTAECRKRRIEVLNRLARIGAGLSAAQKNDWTWFKEAWDEKMVDVHGADWGGVFAGWMKKVLNDVDLGVANAFSLLVNGETRRCFRSMEALSVP